MWTIHLPIKVPVSKKRDFTLNLNQYRNTHFQVLNKAKVSFEEVVGPLLKGVPRLGECELSYVLFVPTRQLCDVANICSIVDKFFSDTLVSKGKLEDDNYTIVPRITYSFGGIDKIHPRVEVTIIPAGDTLLNQKEEDMQIILVQAEVEQAIKDYIANRVTLAEGTEIAIDLKAGRGPESFTASIDIVPTAAKPVTTAAAPVKRTVTKAQETTVAATESTAAAQASDEGSDASQEAASPQETASSELTDGANAETGAAETASDETEAAPAPARSLFAGLKKPVNG